MKRPYWMLAPNRGDEGGGTAVLEPPPGEERGAFADLADQLSGREIPEKEDEPEGKPLPAKPSKPEPKEEAKPEKKALKSFDGIPAEVFAKPGDAKPTPEKVETKAEPASLDTDAMAKGMSDKGRANFKRLEEHFSSKMAALEKERDELKAQATGGLKAEEAAAMSRDYEKLKKEHEELSKTIELISAERSPQFQAKFVRAKEEAAGAAAKRVKSAGGDPEKFLKALALEGRSKWDAIEESLNDAPAFVQTQIANLVTQIEEIDEQRAAALQNARGSLQQWGEEETAKQREQAAKMVQAREGRFTELIPEIAKSAVFLREVPGHDQWNAIVKQTVDDARKFLFEGNDFDSFAEAALKAKGYDHLQRVFLAIRDRNLDLEKQIAEMTEAEPGARTGGGAGGGKAPDQDEDASFADIYNRTMEGA